MFERRSIVKQAVLATIDHCRDDCGAYRFQNDHHFGDCHKPDLNVGKVLGERHLAGA